MLAKSISALAALALATHAVAEPMPYTPNFMRSTSMNSLLVRRDGPESSYQPTQEVCSHGGKTCADACGAGYTVCTSGDNAFHCFNSAKESCCPVQDGSSCEIGYYCTTDPTTSTSYCCPNGQDLAACAKVNHINSLVKQEPKPVSSFAPFPTSWPTKNSTATETTSCTSTVHPSGSWPSSNYTSVSAPAPSQTKILEGAGNMFAPASVLALIVAGGAALL